MSSSDEVEETAGIWRIRFEIELLKRGGTEQARQEMIDETPDWLRNILSIPLRFGNHPIDCTCAKWYHDGTHHKDCLHLRNNPQPTPLVLGRAVGSVKSAVFQPELFPVSLAGSPERR